MKLERYRIGGPQGANSGAFSLPLRETVLQGRTVALQFIVSDGGGWDHVSVSLPNRCPRWEELERVRRLVFRDDEVVMQLHVPTADHINAHHHTLHLWRPQADVEIAAVRTEWERSGEQWPYGDLRSPGVIPRPSAAMVG